MTLKAFIPACLRSSCFISGAWAFFLAPTALAREAKAAPAPTAFDIRHEACLDKITDNPEAAYETALTWQNEGGGFRAQHCIAMALFGLGRTELAAHRLEHLGRSPHSVTDSQKADYYFEATGFWIIAEDYKKAKAAANAGLELRPEHIDLLIARARAKAGLKNYGAAKKDLDQALALAPHRADSYRYRADLHLKQNNYDAALRDVEKSFSLDDTQVETAVLRGDIREAMRKDERRAIESQLDIPAPKRPEDDKADTLIVPPFVNQSESVDKAK